MNIEESAKRIRECIERIKKGFQDDMYPNEASISRQAVEPILRELKWPADNAAVVCYEYSLQGKRADIALLHQGKPTVIIEVKQPGSAEGAEKQLFEYVFHAGRFTCGDNHWQGMGVLFAAESGRLSRPPSV